MVRNLKENIKKPIPGEQALFDRSPKPKIFLHNNVLKKLHKTELFE